MNKIHSLTHQLSDVSMHTFNIAELTGTWKSHLVTLFNKIPEKMQKNQILAIAIFSISNAIFLLLLNEITKRLQTEDEVKLEFKQKLFKHLAIDVALVGGFTATFNFMLSKLLNYRLNFIVIGAISTAMVAVQYLMREWYLKKPASVEINANSISSQEQEAIPTKKKKKKKQDGKIEELASQKTMKNNNASPNSSTITLEETGGLEEYEEEETDIDPYSTPPIERETISTATPKPTPADVFLVADNEEQAEPDKEPKVPNSDGAVNPVNDTQPQPQPQPTPNPEPASKEELHSSTTPPADETTDADHKPKIVEDEDSKTLEPIPDTKPTITPTPASTTDDNSNSTAQPETQNTQHAEGTPGDTPNQETASTKPAPTTEEKKLGSSTKKAPKTPKKPTVKSAGSSPEKSPTKKPTSSKFAALQKIVGGALGGLAFGVAPKTVAQIKKEKEEAEAAAAAEAEKIAAETASTDGSSTPDTEVPTPTPPATEKSDKEEKAGTINHDQAKEKSKLSMSRKARPPTRKSKNNTGHVQPPASEDQTSQEPPSTSATPTALDPSNSKPENTTDQVSADDLSNSTSDQSPLSSEDEQ